MIHPTALAAHARADGQRASRIRSVLEQACTAPAPCTSVAAVELREGGGACIARVSHGRLTAEEEDTARIAAANGIVVVRDDAEPPLVAAPAGPGRAVVARLRHVAGAARVERVEALGVSVGLALETEQLGADAHR